MCFVFNQCRQVAVDGSTNNTTTKFEVPVTQEKPASESSSSSSIASAASVFMADVANLIKYGFYFLVRSAVLLWSPFESSLDFGTHVGNWDVSVLRIFLMKS